MKMDPLYTLLQKIRKRPGLYIEEKQLIYLYYLIIGYVDRAHESDPNYQDFLNFWEFTKFVQSYYDIEFIGGRNWKSLILDNTNSQEEAFDKFYELLDEFVKKNGNEQENI